MLNVFLAKVFCINFTHFCRMLAAAVLSTCCILPIHVVKLSCGVTRAQIAIGDLGNGMQKKAFNKPKHM